MKQRLLFVIDSLNVGGAEKSLLTLLSVLDYRRFEADVQLFGYGGALEAMLPKEAHLLPPLPLTRFLHLPRWRQIATLRLSRLAAGWRYSRSVSRPGLNHADRARLYLECFAKHIADDATAYDAAIAYGQNLPTLHVADKVKAKKKFAWVNVSYNPAGENVSYYAARYALVDNVVTVSPSAKAAFLKTFPQFSEKTVVIRDMLDDATIEHLSTANCSTHLATDKPALLTMARLKIEQKGYDISLEACRLLKERGLSFRWYALGEGPARAEMERYIRAHHLEDCFILLGAFPNPYPILRQCRLYVQTSRYEGFGLSIAEARILNKPVVTTEFDAVYAQMVPGENGLVVPQDPVAVADAVERLLSDADLYLHIVGYLKQEKKGNTEEIEKFYNLLQE